MPSPTLGRLPDCLFLSLFAVSPIPQTKGLRHRLTAAFDVRADFVNFELERTQPAGPSPNLETERTAPAAEGANCGNERTFVNSVRT